MNHNIHTLQSALWKGFGATLLGVVLVGCGSNGATDNTSTAPTGSGTSSTDTTSASANSGAMNSAQPATGTGTSGPSTSGGASAASFAGAAATWTKIQSAKTALDAVIASKKLKTVHEAAFKVRDIVRTLPTQSSGLSPDKAKTLATQVKNVDQLAGKLDEAGDAGNLKATQDNQAGLSDTLDTIHDLYPSGTFK